MYRNERYFDKNDREQNYFGQSDEGDADDVVEMNLVVEDNAEGVKKETKRNSDP